MTNQIASIDGTLEALADPTRRAIVELLVKRPFRASELADVTGVARPRMSKHLRVLLEAGITRDERPAEDARARVFHLQPDAIDSVRDWLDRLQREWDTQLESFKNYVEEKKK